jgi:hypothetical protein
LLLEKEENEKLLEDFPFVYNPAVFLRKFLEGKEIWKQVENIIT